MTDQKTLRDEFAMAAMREILAHPDTRNSAEFSDNAFKAVAYSSYKMADAMMTERETRTQKEKQ